MQPEEAGIGIEFLFVRASVLAAILLLLIGAVFLPTSASAWLVRGRRGDLTLFHLLFVVSQCTFFIICAGTFLALFRYSFQHGAVSSTISALIIAALVTLAEGSLVLRAVGYRAGSGLGPALAGQLSLRYAAGAILAWLILVFPFAAVAGELVGRAIENGSAIDTPLLSIPKVDVYVSAAIPHPPGLAKGLGGETMLQCVLRIGADGAELILYDAERSKVVRVTREQVISLQPPDECSPTDRSSES